MMKTIRQALNALAKEHAFGWEQTDANAAALFAELDLRINVDRPEHGADDTARMTRRD